MTIVRSYEKEETMFLGRYCQFSITSKTKFNVYNIKGVEFEVPAGYRSIQDYIEQLQITADDPKTELKIVARNLKIVEQYKKVLL